jgi:hypothetical protein
MVRHSCSTWVIAQAIISLVLVSTHSGRCQQNKLTMHTLPAGCSNIFEDGLNNSPQYREIRTIEDSGTHQHWILLQNVSRPAAPALLLQGVSDLSCARPPIEEAGSRSAIDARSHSDPVIHAGDYLIVSEHTRVLDTDLEATALKPAAIGDILTVRLKFGGQILSAIATAPGRATLSQKRSEVRQ